MAGAFISFEGPDGAGKTTVLAKIMPELKAHLTRPVILTREPGGAKISEQIRQVILDPQNTAMDPRTEALLYAASRRQHLTEVIRPALAKDEVVICDRFVDSSVAYQGAGRNIGEAAVLAMNQFATAGLQPELTLYLDISPELGLARIKAHQDQRQYDRLDQEQLAFHQRVHAAYLRLAQGDPQRIKTIDAAQSLDEVTAACLQVLSQHLQQIWR